MKKLISIVISLLLSPVSIAQWAAPSAVGTETVVLRGGWLFDGISDERVPNTGIIIREGKFAEVGAALAARDLEGARIIDLDDSETIIPGMFDLHAHYNLDLVDDGRAEEVPNNAMLFLANGVTSTWSAGEYNPERAIAARDRIDSGQAAGTRVFNSGPYFGAFRCEYQIRTAADECIGWPNDITEKELRREVDYWAERGVISIKIKQASASETRILIDQADKNGMTTTGHLANYDDVYDVHARDAIAMNLDRLEHWITLEVGGEENSELSEMIALILQHGVYFDPNLQMYGDGKLRHHSSLDMVWTDEGRFFTPYARKRLQKRVAADPTINSRQPSDFPQRAVK